MEQVTGLHRKSVLRLLHAPNLERKKREKGRGRTYGQALDQVILVVWESLVDYICAERLKPALLCTARHLPRFGSMQLTCGVEEQLGHQRSHRLFQPVLHLQEKRCQGEKVARSWDQVQMPYQRLLATGQLSPEQHTRLYSLYEQTNPLVLRRERSHLLAALWEVPSADTHVA